MSTVTLEFDRLWRSAQARTVNQLTADRTTELQGGWIAAKAWVGRSRYIEYWLGRSLAEYAAEVQELEMLEAEHAFRVREKKERLQRIEEQIRAAEDWRAALDEGAGYLIQNRQLTALPRATSVSARTGDTPRWPCYPGEPVAGLLPEEAENMSFHGARQQSIVKEGKSRQLLISSSLALGVCLSAILMAVGSLCAVPMIAPAHFWMPIAVGTFGVAGSNILYLWRIWR